MGVCRVVVVGSDGFRWGVGAGWCRYWGPMGACGVVGSDGASQRAVASEANNRGVGEVTQHVLLTQEALDVVLVPGTASRGCMRVVRRCMLATPCSRASWVLREQASHEPVTRQSISRGIAPLASAYSISRTAVRIAQGSVATGAHSALSASSG
jgi:hypothetical protein